MLRKNYKLKELRDIKSISQAQLARKLGLSESTYNKKENGISDFTESEIRNIIKIFNCSADNIFFDKEVAKITTKGEKND